MVSDVNKKTGPFFLGLFLLVPSLAWADFTADQLLTAIQGGQRDVLYSKVFSQGKKTRIEVQIPGRESVQIARKDKNPPVVWTLLPDHHLYIESSDKKKDEAKKEFLGIETLEGHPCKKYRVSLYGPTGIYTGLQWEATDLGDTPIRQEYQRENQTLVIELKNIQVQPLESTLFEIPAGYKKAEGSPFKQRR
jgi:hypothetical protein